MTEKKNKQNKILIIVDNVEKIKRDKMSEKRQTSPTKDKKYIIYAI